MRRHKQSRLTIDQIFENSVSKLISSTVLMTYLESVMRKIRRYMMYNVVRRCCVHESSQMILKKNNTHAETPAFAQIWTVSSSFGTHPNLPRSGLEENESHKNCNNPFILPTKVQIRLGKRERVKYHEIDLRIFPDRPS